MSPLVIALAIFAQLTTTPTPTPEQMNARLTELAARYRSSSGEVDVARMSKEDAKEYFNIQAFLVKNDLLDRCKVPTACKLDELPAPDASMFDAKADATEMGHAAVLSRGKDWLFVALVNESMLPLPKGWQLVQDSEGAHLTFPKAEWTAGGARRETDPRGLVELQVMPQPAKDADAVHASYQAAFASYVDEKKIVISEVTQLDGGRGYFLVRSPDIRKLSLVYFAPDTKHKGEGFVCVANLFEEKWGAVRPVLETMLANWYTLDGRALGGEVKLSGLAFAPAAKPAEPAKAGPPAKAEPTRTQLSAAKP